MAECRELAAWAEAFREPRPIAPQAEIERSLAFLAATLPSKSVDTETGKDRLAVYVTVLAGCSPSALRFMSKRVVETCRWFPTPAECLAILASHREPETERSQALRLCASFAHDAFEQWLANLSDGGEIGDVPEQWERIAVERGPLRRLEDGAIVVRAKYHGPFKSIAA